MAGASTVQAPPAPNHPRPTPNAPADHARPAAAGLGRPLLPIADQRHPSQAAARRPQPGQRTPSTRCPPLRLLQAARASCVPRLSRFRSSSAHWPTPDPIPLRCALSRPCTAQRTDPPPARSARSLPRRCRCGAQLQPHFNDRNAGGRNPPEHPSWPHHTNKFRLRYARPSGDFTRPRCVQQGNKRYLPPATLSQITPSTKCGPTTNRETWGTPLPSGKRRGLACQA